MTIPIKEDSWTPNPVSNMTINQDQGGITWSFAEAASTDSLKHNPLAIRKADLPKSEPIKLGKIPKIFGENIISHNGITIKRSGSLNIGIPNSLNFTAGVGLFITRDLIKLCGVNDFKECEIGLIVQRTLVEPKQASRPIFSKWHDHLSGPNPLSLTYQFSDVLQTELLSPEGGVITAPDRSLIRMGGGIQHRSQTNLTGQALLRTWGAFLVYDGATKPIRGIYPPHNNAFSKTNTPDGIPCASTITNYGGFSPLPQPKALF